MKSDDELRDLLQRIPAEKRDMAVSFLEFLVGSKTSDSSMASDNGVGTPHDKSPPFQALRGHATQPSPGAGEQAQPAQAAQSQGEHDLSSGGIHALLKLGFATGARERLIKASDTLQCLDSINLPAYLGTNSQAVSERFRRLIKRLYLLSDEDDHGRHSGEQTVVRVVDVSDVVTQEMLPQNARLCPEGMGRARTWFKVDRVWRVENSPSVKEIRLLKTGVSISRAITAGRATFFYVSPIEGLQLVPVASRLS